MKWYFILAVVVPFGIACLFAFINHLLPEFSTIGRAGLWILVFSYLFAMLQPFVWLIVNAGNIKSFFGDPMAPILTNLNVTTVVDSYLLRQVSRYSKEHLDLFLLELSLQKEHLEKRTSLIAGSVEKIGLAPGVLAIVIGFSINYDGDWARALACAVMFFYVCAVIARFQAMRLERFIKIVELAAKSKTN